MLHCSHIYVTVTVTQSCDIYKVIKASETNDIIKYSNNISAIWKVYIL